MYVEHGDVPPPGLYHIVVGGGWGVFCNTTFLPEQYRLSYLIIIKVFLKHKILSLETIQVHAPTHARTHACTHTHRGTHMYKYSGYIKLNIRSLKWAANALGLGMDKGTWNRKYFLWHK